MLTLPTELLTVIVSFAPLFSKPVWEHVKVLIVGAILAPGKRTVTAALRVMGLSTEKNFQTYHRLLNRATWSVWAASRLLLRLLVTACVPCGPLVFGIDDTIERRRGDQIAAKGIYRDPVRSSQAHFVTSQGAAVAVWYAAVRSRLGRARLGAARVDRVVSFRTILSAAGSPASDADRTGLADYPTGRALAAKSGRRLCRR